MFSGTAVPNLIKKANLATPQDKGRVKPVKAGDNGGDKPKVVNLGPASSAAEAGDKIYRKPEILFYCPFCPLTTKFKFNMKRHIELLHRDQILSNGPQEFGPIGPEDGLIEDKPVKPKNGKVGGAVPTPPMPTSDDSSSDSEEDEEPPKKKESAVGVKGLKVRKEITIPLMHAANNKRKTEDTSGSEDEEPPKKKKEQGKEQEKKILVFKEPVEIFAKEVIVHVCRRR